MLRRITPSVLLPVLVYEIGNGALAPVLVLIALDEGASTAFAGLIVTLAGVGRILGAVPAAWLTNRVGDRRAMLVAAVVTAVALAWNWAMPEAWGLAIGQLVIGVCIAVYYLARQTYISEVVAVHLRARALSVLGGVHRIGLFIGPFVGALAIHFWGTRVVFGVAIATTVVTGLILTLVSDAEGSTFVAGARAGEGLVAAFRGRRQLFLTLGVAILLIGAVRAARQTVIPLWGEHIGLSATTVSLVFGIASAVDMSLFYPAGHVMDRWGRLAVGIPSMVVLGVGTALLPLSHGAMLLGLFAVVMSVGNGIGSGIVMTLGADAAPVAGRTSFLAIWRLLGDTGTAIGPLVPVGIATVSTLGVGIAVTGLLGVAAAAGLARWVPQHSPLATRAMARAHHTRLTGGAPPPAPM